MPRHTHAPWRKSVLIPSWAIQLFFTLLMILVLALALGLINSNWGKNTDSLTDDVKKASKIVAPIYIGILTFLISLTITEIILLARHKLKPLVFLVMNVIKTTIWTGFFVIDMIGIGRGARAGVGGIIIAICLLVSFWTPLIYGSIIYHRFRTEKKSYKDIEDPAAMPLDTSYPPVPYPSQPYKGASVIESNIAKPSAGARRASYNHERDVRFESYRKSRTQSPENEPLTSGTPIPELYVEHHDGDNTYEMASRRELR